MIAHERDPGWDVHWYSYVKIWWRFRRVKTAVKAMSRLEWEMTLRKDAKSLHFLRWAHAYILRRLHVNNGIVAIAKFLPSDQSDQCDKLWNADAQMNLIAVDPEEAKHLFDKTS